MNTVELKMVTDVTKLGGEVLRGILNIKKKLIDAKIEQQQLKFDHIMRRNPEDKNIVE